MDLAQEHLPVEVILGVYFLLTHQYVMFYISMCYQKREIRCKTQNGNEMQHNNGIRSKSRSFWVVRIVNLSPSVYFAYKLVINVLIECQHGNGKVNGKDIGVRIECPRKVYNNIAIS